MGEEDILKEREEVIEECAQMEDDTPTNNFLNTLLEHCVHLRKMKKGRQEGQGRRLPLHQKEGQKDCSLSMKPD